MKAESPLGCEVQVHLNLNKLYIRKNIQRDTEEVHISQSIVIDFVLVTNKLHTPLEGIKVMKMAKIEQRQMDPRCCRKQSFRSET